MTATYVKNTAASAAMILLLVGSCLLIGTAPGRADDKPAKPDTWKTYTYAEQGFSATFPVEPKKTGKGPLSFDAPVADGAIQYTVAVSDGPPKELAKVTFDAVVKNFGDKVKSQRDIELQGFPGRELVIELEVKGIALIVTNRIYIANGHIYQSLVTSQKSKQEEAQTKKFLDSFKLITDAPK